MATCKDCLSYDICSYHAATKAMHGLIEEKLVYIANQIPCKFFKPNPHYVEIPCYCKECEYHEDFTDTNILCTRFEKYFKKDFYCAVGERRCEE